MFTHHYTTSVEVYSMVSESHIFCQFFLFLFFLLRIIEMSHCWKLLFEIISMINIFQEINVFVNII